VGEGGLLVGGEDEEEVDTRKDTSENNNKSFKSSTRTLNKSIQVGECTGGR
jgi:hypothetical protein